MFEVRKVRYFTNHRGLVGFSTKVYFGEREIGEATHDGNAIMYNLFIKDIEDRRAFLKWADSIADQTIWDPAQHTLHRPSDRDLFLENCGVEFMLNKYEEKLVANA